MITVKMLALGAMNIRVNSRPYLLIFYKMYECLLLDHRLISKLHTQLGCVQERVSICSKLREPKPAWCNQIRILVRYMLSQPPDTPDNIDE